MSRPNRSSSLLVTAAGREKREGRPRSWGVKMLQRVRVAMAFPHDPQLVLLDEPGTSLDEPAVALLHATLSRLLGRGCAANWCEPAGSRSDFAFDRRLRLEEGALHAI